MNAEMVPIGSVSQDPANARIHSAANLEAIKGSLRRFGQQKPLVVDRDGVVRAGNGTLLAARSLGWDEIAVVRTQLTGAEATAYAIADNRTGEMATWDKGVLAKSLAALRDDAGNDPAAPLDGTGFDLDGLRSMFPANAAIPGWAGLNEAQNHDVPAVPDAPEDPTTEVGDLWLMGTHRLVCGDATACAPFMALFDGDLADKRAAMVFADPPFDMEPHQFEHLLEEYSEDAHVFVMCDDRQLQPLLAGTDMVLDRCFVMDVGFGVPHGVDAYVQHIMVLRLKNGSPKPMRLLGDGFSSIIRMRYRGNLSGDEALGHKHQKPVDAVAEFIAHFTDAGQLVLDPFMGTGTSLIAAEGLGRTCYGIEQSPAWCDVIVKRWEQMSGGTAVHQQANRA